MYRPLVRTRHSRSLRLASALPSLPSKCLTQRRNRPHFSVDITGVMGMGAVLSHAIRFCRYAETQGWLPQISSSNPLYSVGPGVDCLTPYLETATSRLALRPLRFQHSESFFHLPIPKSLELEDASRIFWEFFRPREFVVAQVDALLADVAIQQFDLSLHYRGTDKFIEANTVSFESFEDAIIRHTLAGGRLRHVFLATDDGSFEAKMRARWPDTEFTTFNLGGPCAPGIPRHFSDISPQDKALESIVNMLLLARAPTCIRSSSYMSGMSKILNPELRTVTVNRTLKGRLLFPEWEIVSCESNQGCPPGNNRQREHRSSRMTR